MKKDVVIEDKLRQMLELLSEGASTEGLARKMGYSEGTVRVYLHNLYRVLGVRNRTEAVLWHMRSTRAQAADAAPATAGTNVPPVAQASLEESFGEAAEREGLLAALGVMESFLGPYGRMWEVSLKLKGTEVDATAASRRTQARALWRALLAADFGAGKRLCDNGADLDILRRSPEAVLLVLLLQTGGYTHAGDRATSRITRRTDSPVSAREV